MYSHNLSAKVGGTLQGKDLKLAISRMRPDRSAADA